MDIWLRRRLSNFCKNHPRVAALIAAWAMLDIGSITVHKAVDFVRNMRVELHRLMEPIDYARVDNSDQCKLLYAGFPILTSSIGWLCAAPSWRLICYTRAFPGGTSIGEDRRSSSDQSGIAGRRETSGGVEAGITGVGRESCFDSQEGRSRWPQETAEATFGSGQDGDEPEDEEALGNSEEGWQDEALMIEAL